MLGICSTGASTLHLVYEMRDSWQWQPYIGIISKKGANEIRKLRRSKSCTPLHCLVNSFNPR